MTDRAAVPMPTAVLPPASARRLRAISTLLSDAEEVYEDLLDQLALHDVVIGELVARVHPEGGDHAGSRGDTAPD